MVNMDVKRKAKNEASRVLLESGDYEIREVGGYGGPSGHDGNEKSAVSSTGVRATVGSISAYIYHSGGDIWAVPLYSCTNTRNPCNFR